jgi:hypothetical protein
LRGFLFGLEKGRLVLNGEGIGTTFGQSLALAEEFAHVVLDPREPPWRVIRNRHVAPHHGLAPRRVRRCARRQNGHPVEPALDPSARRFIPQLGSYLPRLP